MTFRIAVVQPGQVVGIDVTFDPAGCDSSSSARERLRCVATPPPLAHPLIHPPTPLILTCYHLIARQVCDRGSRPRRRTHAHRRVLRLIRCIPRPPYTNTPTLTYEHALLWPCNLDTPSQCTYSFPFDLQATPASPPSPPPTPRASSRNRKSSTPSPIWWGATKETWGANWTSWPWGRSSMQRRKGSWPSDPSRAGSRGQEASWRGSRYPTPPK